MTPPIRQTISLADYLQDSARFDALLDARSESEFTDDHLPGAINAPVLNDAERVEVGTLYKQVSPFDARRRGAALVAHNIGAFIERELAGKPREWVPLVYCWRGGERSAALAHVLGRVGWHTRQLEGGYRGYRRHVVEQLSILPAHFDFRVVCGKTGSGKSRLLQQLASAGAQVLDLEQLAHHRGSVLGGLPSQPQPSQKTFETRIWSALRAYSVARPVFIESESRKVGDLRVPDALIVAMRAAACIHVEVPTPERVKLLRDEYEHLEKAPERLAVQLDCLMPLHGRERVEAWKALADHGRWDELVERLLVEHYDPAYQRSIRRNFVRIEGARLLAINEGTRDAFASAARELAAEAG
jgi:tRNA 2-selenouridine synthase